MLLGQSNLRCSDHVAMMAKTCLTHNPVWKSLRIGRLESLRLLHLDNTVIGFSEKRLTDVDGDFSRSLPLLCLRRTELQPT